VARRCHAVPFSWRISTSLRAPALPRCRPKRGHRNLGGADLRTWPEPAECQRVSADAKVGNRSSMSNRKGLVCNRLWDHVAHDIWDEGRGNGIRANPRQGSARRSS
jgi:hypothetical protein